MEMLRNSSDMTPHRISWLQENKQVLVHTEHYQKQHPRNVHSYQQQRKEWIQIPRNQWLKTENKTIDDDDDDDDDKEEEKEKKKKEKKDGDDCDGDDDNNGSVCSGVEKDNDDIMMMMLMIMIITRLMIIGTLRSTDADGNENVKKQ